MLVIKYFRKRNSLNLLKLMKSLSPFIYRNADCWSLVWQKSARDNIVLWTTSSSARRCPGNLITLLKKMNFEIFFLLFFGEKYNLDIMLFPE